MRSFYDVTREELEQMLAPLEADGRRLSRRLFGEIYRGSKKAWSEITRLSPKTQAFLQAEFDLGLSPVTESQTSSDSSEKLVVSFADGLTAEAILMPWGGRRARPHRLAQSLQQRARRVSVQRVVRNLRTRDVLSRLKDLLIGRHDLKTACISTQVGCAMGCTFCYTGTRGLKRNLEAGEIVEQFVSLRHKARIGGLVFMGMGEPLHNFDNLVRACRILQDPAGLAISGDRIHVSTCGLVPAMDKLAQSVDVRLALSLNATTDAVRSRVMPVNNRWTIREVIGACHRYVRRARGPIMVEYVLLAGVNDTPEDSVRLVDLLRGLDATVQLIPFNGFEGAEFQRPEPDVIARFRSVLAREGIPHTVRFSKAADVAGACGQLGLSVAEGRARGRRGILAISR
jgi:23S rRNA (adenine2503-C2)-methyltransferase